MTRLGTRCTLESYSQFLIFAIVAPKVGCESRRRIGILTGVLSACGLTQTVKKHKNSSPIFCLSFVCGGPHKKRLPTANSIIVLAPLVVATGLSKNRHSLLCNRHSQLVNDAYSCCWFHYKLGRSAVLRHVCERHQNGAHGGARKRRKRTGTTQKTHLGRCRH